jgi:hypothetical protein
MGSNQDIMHGFVQQEINRFFSRSDGWNLVPQEPAEGYTRRYIAERTIQGKREIQNLVVTFEKNVPAGAFDQMRTSGTGAYGQKISAGIAAILPRNADVSTVPDDVRIYFMNSFAIRDGELTWVKRSFPRPEEKKILAES